MKKKTLVIGASDNPERYSYKVTQRLSAMGADVTAVGIREGMIGNVKILTGFPVLSDVDTVTLYVGEKNQPHWYDYIFSLKPKRIIFNPGAENPELEKMAEKKGIEVLQACSLTMLSVGNY